MNDSLPRADHTVRQPQADQCEQWPRTAVPGNSPGPLTFLMLTLTIEGIF